jgi:hypothetical protein
MDDKQRFTNAILFGGLSFLLGCIVGARTPPTRSDNQNMTDMQTQTIYQPMMAHEIMELRNARALCREWPTHRAFEQRKIVEDRIKKIRHERYLPCLIMKSLNRLNGK